MPVVTCEGIVMTDPRDSIKVEAAEALYEGYSCYVGSDGLAYLCDDNKSTVCHGFALTDIAAGRKVTLVKWCRMKVGTTQTPGARIYTGLIAGGSAPSTTLSADGIVVGHAISDDLVYAAAPAPAADG